jgi:hypothetical protein
VTRIFFLLEAAFAMEILDLIPRIPLQILSLVALFIYVFAKKETGTISLNSIN